MAKSTPDRTLARLRDPDDPALSELAALVGRHVAARPLVDAVDAPRLAAHAATALRSLATDDARDHLVSRLDEERARLGAETRTPRAWMVPEVDGPLRELLSEAWVPSEDLAYEVINHEALRSMLREVLKGALTRFAGGMRTLDQGVLGGLGGRVARKGAGLLGGVASRAEGIAQAMKDEVEQRFEGRIKETLGQTTDEAVRAVAAWVSDPAHAAVLASLRVSVLDTVLDTPVGELIGEFDELDTARLVAAVWGGLEAAAARDDLEAELQERIEQTVSVWGDETVGAWLDDLGLRASWDEAIVELMTAEMRPLVATEEFGTWWQALHS